jgi:hypothetical protein
VRRFIAAFAFLFLFGSAAIHRRFCFSVFLWECGDSIAAIVSLILFGSAAIHRPLFLFDQAVRPAGGLESR